MELKLYIGIIAGLCSLGGYIPFALEILRGEQKPQRAAWLIWTLSSSLIVLSYFQLGAVATIWVPLAYVIGTAGITLLSFTRGSEGWGFLERVSLLVAAVSAIRWVFFNNVLFTLLINLSVSLAGYTNRIKKLAAHVTKEEQDLPGWTLYFIGALLNMFALESWRIEISALPITYFIMNGITFALIIRNHMRNKKEALQTNI